MAGGVGVRVLVLPEGLASRKIGEGTRWWWGVFVMSFVGVTLLL